MLEGVVQIVCPHCDRDNRIPRALLYARLPAQAVFIAWALRATR